jgi:hypothetical protein
MTQALTVKPQQQVSRYNEQDIRQEMSILRSAFPKLNAPDDALRALVIASKFSGLNPFRGEIYYIPNVGISVASKIKANDAVTYQAMRGNTLDIKFDLVTPLMVKELHEFAQYDVKEGDVAFLCRIVSSKQRTAYYNHRLQLIDELKALGYQRQELEAELNRRAGPAPEIKALGIVRKAENFGGDNKYSRQDRACKRALQLALNIGGYAAPDTRSYGGVALQDDKPASDQTVDADYSVVPNEPDIPRKPRVQMPDMPMEDGWIVDDAPAPISQERSQQATRGNDDLKSEQPFGETPKPKPQVTPATIRDYIANTALKSPKFTILNWHELNGKVCDLATNYGLTTEAIEARRVPKEISSAKEIQAITEELLTLCEQGQPA